MAKDLTPEEFSEYISRSRIYKNVSNKIKDEEAQNKLIRACKNRKFDEDIYGRIYAKQRDAHKKKKGGVWPVEVSLSQGEDKITRAENTFTDMLEEIIGTKFYAHFKTEIHRKEIPDSDDEWRISIRRRNAKDVIDDAFEKKRERFEEEKQKYDSEIMETVIDAANELTSQQALPSWISLIGGAAGAAGAAIGEGLKEPEVIFYGLPIYSVQRFEKATSDRKIKVRAIGDVFLAHQRGSEVNVTIDAKLFGPFKYGILYALLILQERGEKQLETIEEGELQTFIDENSDITAAEAKSAAQDTIKNAGGLLEYEEHRTFPLITQFDIIFNMYLQTIEWHRNIEEGTEVINVHLIFRKWEPKGNIKIFDPESSRRKVYQYPSHSARVRRLLPIMYRFGRFIEESFEGGFRNDLFIEEMRQAHLPELGLDPEELMDIHSLISAGGLK